MNINDVLYFAPDISFNDVDLEGTSLPVQFKQRIEWIYLDPAKY